MKAFIKILRLHYLVVASTYYDTGDTFFGPGRFTSRIDHLICLQSYLSEVEYVCVSKKLGRALQHINTNDMRDHYPLLLRSSISTPVYLDMKHDFDDQFAQFEQV